MRIGIDLGTTNTLASYVNEAGNVCGIKFKNGRLENSYLLPSCISLKNDKIIVGRPALDNEKEYSGRTLRNTKYYMGSDETLMLGRVKADAGTAAEYILREVLDELKRTFPEEKEFHALVTVPARFDTQAPRQETKAALRRAGFLFDEENALMDEPVAAAAAYSRETGDAQNVLVVDIGGGTFDLSLLHSSGRSGLEPLAWGGDRHLGGNDFDNEIFRLISRKISDDTGIILASPDPRDMSYTDEQSAAVSLLLEKMPEIKEQLYGERESADIYCPELLGDYDLDMHISLEEYESAVSYITDKMKKLTEELYSSSPIRAGDTDKVLLAGGMAHEITLRKILESMFGKDKLIIPKEPLYLVARGAAICAGGAEIHIDSKAYSSIGVLIKNRTDVDIVVKEGQTIDRGFNAVRYYHPARDGVTSVTVNIVQFTGDFDIRKCVTAYRGTVTLNGKLPAAKQRIRAEFSMDKDNLFSASFTRLDGSGTEISLRL